MSMSTRTISWQRDVSRPSVWLTWLRNTVLSKLTDLQHGRLTVVDPWGETSVGEAFGTPITVHVNSPYFYTDVLWGGSLGAARSYMDGRWSCDDLTALFRLFVHNAPQGDSLDHGLASVAARVHASLHALRSNTRPGSRRNIQDHYDLGNDLFALFLDSTMTYSSGIFQQPGDTMEQASITKLDRICHKLALTRDDHVLEIGSGWGSFAIHAATHFGCRVTTTTISQQQFDLAMQRLQTAGISDRVELLLCDYRDLSGQYDKLVSIEMIEAVGHKHLPAYFAKCAELLKPDGQMLLQAITMPDQRYDQYLKHRDFIQRYVFPGSCCPALTAMLRAVKVASDMKLVHMEDIAPHYARTLQLWRNKFKRNEDKVLALGYPPRFVRMWEYYLSYCEAGFAERYLGDVQLLLAKPDCRAEPILASLT